MTTSESGSAAYWEEQERFFVALARRAEAGGVEGDPAEAAREVERALRMVRRAAEKRRRAGR